MDYEKAYNDLIARINEVKEKPSLCMKDKHHYNGYVETGIRDALEYIVSPESEDERIRKALAQLIITDIEELIKSADSRTYFSGVKEYLEDIRQFAYNKGLVDAKEKYEKEQKPAEWSEEDENKLYQVMEVLLADKTIALRDNPHCKALHKAYDELLDWLKSLRPQSHWKPSKEQMEALQVVIEHGLAVPNREASLAEGHIESLYHELKKLL